MRQLSVLATALIVLGAPLSSQYSVATDALVRVRLIVSSTAATTDIRVSGATIASYSSTVLTGVTGLHSSQTGDTLRLSRNTPGELAEARFDIILADVAPMGAITWNVQANAAAELQLEIYGLDDLARPRLADRFRWSGDSAHFTTRAALLDSRSALRLDRFVPRLVLAHFYPWYSADAWNDPQLADRPLRLYSTDVPSDVAVQAHEARAAGIDAFVVSWQGSETDGGVHDRRMRLVLDAVRDERLQACVYTETYVANPDNTWGAPVDLDTMLTWLTDIVDRYGGHPAYLRVGGRPVIFVYAASLLQAPDWMTIVDRLRASGRNPLLIGDFYESNLIDAFDGEYQYSNVALPRDAIRGVDRAQGLRVRTYHLLGANGRRRLWVASVSPGYDDRRIADRAVHQVVERAGGQHYIDQWQAAVDTDADWIVITSWNEWYENTEIEPSIGYGATYLNLTAFWSRRFKSNAP